MSWQALDWAAKQKTGSPHAKLLLLLLANRADENGICWPSQLSLAEQAEQSDDTVQRHLKSLEGRFILRARARRTAGRWPGYIYQLLMPSVPVASEAALQQQPSQARARRDAIRRAKTAPLPASSGVATEPLRAARSSGLPTTPTEPLAAVRSGPLSAVSPGRSERCHQPAESGVEPVIEPSDEPSRLETSGRRKGSEPEAFAGSRGSTVAAAIEVRPKALRANAPRRLDHIHARIASRIGPSGWEVLQQLSPDALAQIEGMERSGHLTDQAIEGLCSEHRLMRTRQ